MSTMRNSVMLIGRPTQKPQYFEFDNNDKKATFKLSVKETYKDALGETKELTQDFFCVGYGRIAERLKLVRQNQEIAVDGRLDVSADDGKAIIQVNDLFVIEP